MKYGCTVVVACGIAALGSVAHVSVAGAQSLADIARQEKERRKAVAAPAKVYTEADVQKMAPLTTAAARPAPAPADGTQPAEGAADAAKASAADSKPSMPADEAGWQTRVQQARDDLARSRRLLAAMEQQLLALGVQNGNEIAAGKPASGAAKQEEAYREVERLKAEVAKYTAAMAQLDSDARAAGVPPGWVR